MSKVIDFNARDFRLDPSVRGNAGERVFMTTSLGNAEVWEIGDWNWTWAQIFCDKKLEKYTDYVFRFAMTGGHNDTEDAASQMILCAPDGYGSPKEAWENRMCFALAKSRYEPIVSKRDKTGLMRVFEIPFNTGGEENWRFIFVSQHAVARFFAPAEISEYEKLGDLTYDQWWQERKRQLNGGRDVSSELSEKDLADIIRRRIGIGQGIPGLEELAKLFDEDGADDDFGVCGDDKNTKSTEYTERQFASIVKGIGNGSIMDLSNIAVRSDGGSAFYEIGGSVYGSVIDLTDSVLTARAFSMIVKKLGDGCVVDMTNITVTKEGIDNMYRSDVKGDGIVITLDEATLPQKALDLVYDKLGDGGVVSADDFTIK